jgi:hypothetical protein
MQYDMKIGKTANMSVAPDSVQLRMEGSGVVHVEAIERNSGRMEAEAMALPSPPSSMISSSTPVSIPAALKGLSSSTAGDRLLMSVSDFDFSGIDFNAENLDLSFGSINASCINHVECFMTTGGEYNFSHSKPGVSTNVDNTFQGMMSAWGLESMFQHPPFTGQGDFNTLANDITSSMQTFMGPEPSLFSGDMSQLDLLALPAQEIPYQPSRDLTGFMAPTQNPPQVSASDLDPAVACSIPSYTTELIENLPTGSSTCPTGVPNMTAESAPDGQDNKIPAGRKKKKPGRKSKNSSMKQDASTSKGMVQEKVSHGTTNQEGEQNLPNI